MSNDVHIFLGESLRPHGIKGGVLLRLYNDSAKESILTSGLSVHWYKGPDNGSDKVPDSEKNSLPLQVSRVQYLDSIHHRQKIILYFQGIGNINEVLPLLPGKLAVERALFPKLGDKEYYCVDLLGLSVFEHKVGVALGTITSSYFNGAHEVLIISTTNGDIELPFVDDFFPVVDLEGGRVEVSLPKYC
ncbi:MAG: 16S rRNA processing protein RimM [Oligoflexia bacterium]|nr:16S rRNA processing protein RimM [Oligoflexia bacterium]